MEVYKKTEIVIEIEDLCAMIENEAKQGQLPKPILNPTDIKIFKVVRCAGTENVERIIIEI